MTKQETIDFLLKYNATETGAMAVLDNIIRSRKPESIYHYAESPTGPYLELFARRPRAGWHVWGNEVVSDIEI